MQTLQASLPTQLWAQGWGRKGLGARERGWSCRDIEWDMVSFIQFEQGPQQWDPISWVSQKHPLRAVIWPPAMLHRWEPSTQDKWEAEPLYTDIPCSTILECDWGQKSLEQSLAGPGGSDHQALRLLGLSPRQHSSPWGLISLSVIMEGIRTDCPLQDLSPETKFPNLPPVPPWGSQCGVSFIY